MNPGGSFAWILLKVFQVKSFCYMYFTCLYIKKHVLVPETIFLCASEILVLNSYASSYSKIFITNFIA